MRVNKDTLDILNCIFEEQRELTDDEMKSYREICFIERRN